MVFRILLAGVCLALSFGPAAGQVYISGFGGVNFQRDQNSVRVVDSDLAGVVDVDFDPDFVAGGAIGYAFEETPFGRFRVEIEGSYRQADVDGGGTLTGPQAFGGDISAVAGLAMVYYDLSEVSEFVTPFIGAGVGVADIDSEITYAPLGGDPGLPTVAIGGGTETKLAWQAVAGFSVNLVPGIDFVLDGRFFATRDPDFEREIIATDARTGSFESEFEGWNVTGGFRITF